MVFFCIYCDPKGVEWFQKGKAAAVGMGSNLIGRFLADQDYEGMEALVRETLQMIGEIRAV